MADSTQGFSTESPNSRWHYLYYLLAGFNLLTISASLYVSHQITTLYTRSIDVNQEWRERLQQCAELEQLATMVNIPGNNIFISGDPAVESERLDEAFHTFNEKIIRLKQGLSLHADAAQVESLLEDLEVLDQTMVAMVNEANLIFAGFRMSQPAQAGQRMARMDQHYHQINQVLNDIQQQVGTIQQQEFAQQKHDMDTLRRYELAIATLLGVMVVSITVYGHRLARQMQISVEDREKAFKTLQKVEMSLREKTTQLEHSFSELKMMQSRLVESEKMSALGVMVAGVAHEINNPINFIHGNLKHAEEYCKDVLGLLKLYQNQGASSDPQVQRGIDAIDVSFILEDFPKLLDSMQSGTARIREIVNSLRTFSHLDKAEFKEANIHDGINSTLMILSNRLRGKPGSQPINVVKDYGILPFVDCYPGELNQVFMNILSNAIDALEEASGQQDKPTITIRTEVLQHCSVAVHILDNGPGIPVAIAAKIFDPFFTTKEVGKGTGLGLFISYKIVVENHGGRLRCCSIPGQGTEFIIEIPILQTRSTLSSIQDKN